MSNLTPAGRPRAHYSIQSQCTHLMINDDHHHVIIIIIIIIGYPGCSFSSSLNSEMVGYMFSLLIIFCTLKFHLSLLALYTLYLGALRKEYSMILCKYSYKFSIGYLLSIFILSCKLGIPHICHGRHGRRPCKFFLPGVNFYRFNAKNWQFTV